MMVSAKRCPNCPPSENPVCAQAENETVVKTFSNICLLNKESCVTGKGLYFNVEIIQLNFSIFPFLVYTIKHEGKCGTYGHSDEVEE